MKSEIGKTVSRIASGYGAKLLLIGLLLVCFIPPIVMVGEIIRERESRSTFAREEVIASWGGRSDISGPYLLVPMTSLRKEILENGKEREVQVRQVGVLFPESLQGDITLESEIRSRGIYEIPLFLARLHYSGTFDTRRLIRNYPHHTIHWEEAHIAMNFRNLEGIRNFDTALLDGKTVSFEPSYNEIVTPADYQETPSLGRWGPRIAAKVDLSLSARAAERALNYELAITLGGGGSISLVPVARQTEVTIRSDWPAPGFFGAMLPEERSISQEGFSASWEISHLSRNLPSATSLTEMEALIPSVASFGVNFYQSDDPYIKNTRSFKYAYLFLIVPFITFFLFEIIRKERIHPIQYLLAGSADVVFYLLLLSLSEQFSFSAAYLFAAGGITLLLGAYGMSVLKGIKGGALMGGMIGLAYGYLYFVLQSEDYALLLGSVGLFVVLALVMFLTRKVRWY